MLIDAFLYAGERDILELRMEILKDKVDQFIAVEGTHTFTGLPRSIEPLYYPRLQHHIVSDFPEASPRNAWKREMWQRNKILDALSPYRDSDMVLVSDVDEIPNPKDIPSFVPFGELVRFQHELYHFHFHLHVIGDKSAKKGWSCASLCRLGDLRVWYPQGVRNQIPATIIYSGWHFSWFHDPETKLRSYSHQELNEMEGDILTRLQRRWGYQYEHVKGCKHLPLVVQQNPERWKKYFEKGEIPC